MITTLGSEILHIIYGQFSQKYIANNPGCNGDDIEREFLYIISKATMTNNNWIVNMIDRIR